jgi:hypothetical protein
MNLAREGNSQFAVKLLEVRGMEVLSLFSEIRSLPEDTKGKLSGCLSRSLNTAFCF